MNENNTIPNESIGVSLKNPEDVPEDFTECINGLASVIGNTIGNLPYEEFVKNATVDEKGTLHYSMNLKLDGKEET